MNAIGYIRVSTQEQARTGISIPDQEERIRAYCSSVKLDLTDIYRDPGVSAGIPLEKRPAGALLLSDLSENIIALKLDRLFRNVRDCLTCVEEWDKRGVTLHLLDFGGQALNTKTAMGRAFLTVSAAFGELERNLASERIRNAMERLAIEGTWRGGPLPMGYRYTEEGIEVDEDGAGVVREIFRLRAAGNSTDRIAAILYHRGVPGHQGGRRFSPSSVKYICRNTSYINRNNGYEAGLPVFLERELWDQVQAVDIRQQARPRGIYLLTGLITCSLCDGPMHHKPAVTGHRSLYQCTGRKVWQDCKGVSISDHSVEPTVLEEFFERVESEGYREAAAAEKKKDRSSRPRSEIDKLLIRQDRLLSLYLDSKIDRETLDRRSLELTSTLERLRQEVVDLQTKRALPPAWEGNIREDWELLNIDEKKQALSLFVEKVVIHPGRGRDRIEVRWRET